MAYDYKNVDQCSVWLIMHRNHAPIVLEAFIQNAPPLITLRPKCTPFITDTINKQNG